MILCHFFVQMPTLSQSQFALDPDIHAHHHFTLMILIYLLGWSHCGANKSIRYYFSVVLDDNWIKRGLFLRYRYKHPTSMNSQQACNRLGLFTYPLSQKACDHSWSQIWQGAEPFLSQYHWHWQWQCWRRQWISGQWISICMPITDSITFLMNNYRMLQSSRSITHCRWRNNPLDWSDEHCWLQFLALCQVPFTLPIGPWFLIHTKDSMTSCTSLFKEEENGVSSKTANIQIV